jgi:serine/threonine protein kinase/tetratricopeptide (TPR) repeat protein
MNADQWTRIQRVFEQALAQPASRRFEFLGSCGIESELGNEVLSLLAAHDREGSAESLPATWLGVLAVPEPPRFATGEKVAGRYLIQNHLGRGGTGDVFAAWDSELSIHVALKVLHVAGTSADAHRRLKLEGLLARSVWHPNVCRLYDLGRHGDGEDALWFLTMELLRGETLSDRVRRVGRTPADRARPFAEQMATGLGAAHRAGVLHRDFKAGNVMIVTRDDEEQAIVTDFGIARAALRSGVDGNDTAGAIGVIAGTPAYMAPEQLRGREGGPTADIYALGVVLYEMVTGRLPFNEASPLEALRRRLEEEPPSPREVVSDLDERWERVILRCLAREPERRFARAEEVADALTGSTIHATSRSPDGRGWHTLPTEQDAFIGRDAELEALQRALSGDGNVVTLVGAGGMGKTRLVVHYGWRALGTWPGGVWFCDLTEARDTDAIAAIVAKSLGVELGQGDPFERLGHVIAGRGRCLVILDNFEQVADHAAIVARWVERASDASFLVTSRTRLRLENRAIVQTVESLSIDAGTELFSARARKLRPALELAGSELESARNIVRLADGIPLAIELAAARMRVMSAREIVEQMQSRFHLLTGGGSARHETLELVIDASWELLNPTEKRAWAQCSVFEGGFTLDAAESVLDLADDEPASVVDVVQSLVDKSLLRTWVPAMTTLRDIAEPRFGMFVTLQEYARLKLRAQPEDGAGHGSHESATEARHGAWYARHGKAETIDAMDHVGGSTLRERIELDFDNLVVACRRAITRGDPPTAIATYQALLSLLALRGPFRAAAELGRHALQALSLERRERGPLLRAVGQAEWYGGMMVEAQTHLEEALVIARETRDRRSEACVLTNLGGGRFRQGHLEDAAAALETALEAAREVSDQRVECNCLNTLAVIRRGQGRMDEAEANAEKALVAARSAGLRRLEGSILTNIGLLRHDRGRADEARGHYEEALAIHREVGNRRFEGNVHSNLGSLNYTQGLLNEARDHMEKALAIHRDAGDRFAEGIDLNNLGSMAAAQKRPAEALGFFEASLAIQRELGNRPIEGSILASVGRLHQDRGELETAQDHYVTALAIHRAANDPRAEGALLGHLASLHHARGNHEAAREALASGEPLLRKADARFELGQLLCVRAEVEHACGDRIRSRAAFDEALDLAVGTGSGDDSELGRSIAELRAKLE